MPERKNEDRVRYEAGADLASQGKVHRVEGLPGCYVVESAATAAMKYLVVGTTCSCVNYSREAQRGFIERGFRCKHLYAVEIYEGPKPIQPLTEAARIELNASLGQLFRRW